MEGLLPDYYFVDKKPVLSDRGILCELPFANAEGLVRVPGMTNVYTKSDIQDFIDKPYGA